MERGTDWETRAVRERWRRMEERRRAANRLLVAVLAFGAGGIAVLLAASSRVCMPRAEGAVLWCEPVTTPTGNLGLLLVAVLAAVIGVWAAISALG